MHYTKPKKKVFKKCFYWSSFNKQIHSFRNMGKNAVIDLGLRNIRWVYTSP